MFYNRGDFIIEMFSYAVVDEAVHCISSSTQSGVRDRAFVSSAFALRGGVG